MEPRSSRRYESSNSRDESKKSQHREQVSISIPPMRYKLSKLTQAQALFQIAMNSTGFYDMSVNSANWVQHDVRSREFTSYGSLNAPEDMKLVDLITGDDDYYLKLTTKNHKVDYICYNSERNIFEFWGEYTCCVRSMNEIRYRIEKITQRESAKQYPISNGCASSHCNFVDERTPYYTHDKSYGRDECHDDSEFNAPKQEEQYSKFARSQMSKMGFQVSRGLGRNNTGRIAPIDAMTDLGGRTTNKLCGFGFSDMSKEDQKLVDKSGDEYEIACSPPPPPSKDEQPPYGLSRSMSILTE